MILHKVGVLSVVAILVAGSVCAETTTIVRDSYGVPHVYAETMEGAAYGVGYSSAADRLVQIEMRVRHATGRMAELAPTRDNVDADKMARRDHVTAQDAVRQFNSMPEELQVMYRAYVAGINQYVTEALTDPEKLPVEYARQERQPEPFTVQDVFRFALWMMSHDDEKGANEVRNAALLEQLCRKHGPEEGHRIFDDLVWMLDPAAPVTIPHGEGQQPPEDWPFRKYAAERSGGDFDIVLAQECRERDIAARLRERYGFAETYFGSTSMVIAPSRTRSGRRCGRTR